MPIRLIEPRRGWHRRGYLPHLDADGLQQFVTFRLADSLPLEVVRGLAAGDDAFMRADDWLDRGLGACWLRRPDIAAIVTDALRRGDGERYRLLAWCIMPNHVHALIETAACAGLHDILRDWKGRTARAINLALGRRGTLWEADYFDRFIRNDGHGERTIACIEANPVAAGLSPDAASWRWSSAWKGT